MSVRGEGNRHVTGKPQRCSNGQVNAAPLGLAGGELAKHTIGAALLAVLGSAFDGLSAVVTSRALGPYGRGAFAVTLAVAAMVALTACLGITTAGRVALGSPSSRLTMNHYLAVAPLHTLAAAAIGFLAAAGMVVGVVHAGSWGLALAGSAVASGLTLSSFVFDGLHGIGKHRWATGSNVAGSFAALIASLALVSANVGSPAAYLLGLALSLAVQVAVALIVLRRATGWSLAYSSLEHRHLLRSGLPALPYLGSALATFRLDRYLVGALAGVGPAGVYSVAATVSEAARQLPNALGQVLLFGRASGKVSRHLERRARMLVVCAVAGALLLIGTTAEPIVHGLFGNDFAGAVGPLRILLVGELFIAAWLVDSRILIGGNRLGAASMTTILSMGVLFLGDAVLIPQYGIEGAATASVLAYATAWLAAACLLRSGAHDASNDHTEWSRT